MSTNTKLNPLVIILSAVIIIFIASIIYKNMSIDNSETITVSKIQTNKTPKVNKEEYDFTESETNNTEDDFLTIEEKREKHSKNMNNHIMLNTPEKVMDVIIKLQELGREDDANEYIDFLITKFPDYEMSDYIKSNN